MMRFLSPPYALASVLVSMSFFGVTAADDSSQLRGRQIADEADRRNTGFIDSTADLEMALSNAAGETSVRTLRVYILEGTDSGDKSIAQFSAPRDIKDTALLTWSNPDSADDQWLYLPAIKRVKRISSTNRSGSFVGSEFAFEDLGPQEVAKFNYNYLRDENYNEKKTFVVERIPTDKNSGYSKNIIWFDQTNYNTYKIEYYDRSERLLKTLIQSDHRQYLKKYWRPHLMKMSNHQTDKSTTLNWQEYTFGVGLKQSTFTKNKLRSLR